MVSHIAGVMALLVLIQASLCSEIPIRRLSHLEHCYRRPSSYSSLGGGAQGSVDLAYPSTVNMPVAMKEVVWNDPGTLAEIKFLMRFADSESYRGVPRLFDVARRAVPTLLEKYVQFSPSVFIVEQYFKGKPLRECYLDRAFPTEWESNVMRLFYKILTILNQVHQSGYVHGDLHSRNILFDTDGNVMIVDWGCCKTIRTGNNPGASSVRESVRNWISAKLECRFGSALDIYVLGTTAERLLQYSCYGSQAPRLSTFMQLATENNPDKFLSADELLRHEVFSAEQRYYGVQAADELPPFDKVVGLQGDNGQYFSTFELPNDDGDDDDEPLPSRSFSIPGPLQGCFEMLEML